jgi:hypothetical protein
MTADTELTKEDLQQLKKLETTYKSREMNLTPEQQQFIKEKLGSKLWRMNNLYTIRNKEGDKMIMKLNHSQMKVLKKYKHNRKLILKSRQQGISTLFLAYYLDDCWFKPGYQAGIQSYGLDESEKLSIRAELMWDDLSQDIKDLMGLSVVANNSKGMTFSNGSILKIGNFRGDTLQGLHVSELGKIAKKYPEKAKELKTGAFQAVGKNNKITVESTGEGKSGMLFDMWIKAEKHKAQGKPLTPLDFQPIFLSWLEDPDCTLDQEVDIPREVTQYLDDIEVVLDIKLTKQQRWWYAKKKEELTEDMTQEYPTTPDEAFLSGKDGSYYLKLYIEHILKPKHLIKDLYDPQLKVHVVMDLGYNDTMVLLFFQQWTDGVRIIDEYHTNGEPISHYVDMLFEKRDTLGYKYGDIFGPHDIEVTSLNDGKSRKDIFYEYGIVVYPLKKQSVHDGIELVRKWIPKTWIDQDLTYIHDTYVNYRKQWDEKAGVWKDKPLHNEWSNPADAIRYMCQALNEMFKSTKTSKRRKNRGFDV